MNKNSFLYNNNALMNAIINKLDKTFDNNNFLFQL